MKMAVLSILENVEVDSSVELEAKIDFLMIYYALNRNAKGRQGYLMELLLRNIHGAWSFTNVDEVKYQPVE